MKIVITGASGQLGTDLVRVLSNQHDVKALSRKELDVTQAKHAIEMIYSIKPDVIIHAAAFTAVDKAEKQCNLAYTINAYGTKNMAMAAQQIGAKFLYVSTDYVFRGDKGSPYTEEDVPFPLNVYGSSKLLGEQFIASICEKFYIVRTSWLYGAGGENFVKKIFAASYRSLEIPASVDNVGSPTYSYDLACFVKALIHTEKYGIYHAAGRGSCSRYEFVKAILEATRMSHVSVVPVTADHFILPALRPKNTSLDDLVIRANQLPVFRHWRLALQEFIQEDPYFKKGMGAI